MTYRVYNKITFYSGDVMNVVFCDHHSLQQEPLEIHQEERKPTNEESDVSPTNDDEVCDKKDAYKKQPLLTQIHHNH